MPGRFLHAVTVVAALMAAGVQSAPAGAAPGRAAISSHCSRATANAVMTSLDLGINDPPTNLVLCGSFTGPHSNAMVTTIAIPSCNGNFGWYVFRFVNGTWQMALDGSHFGGAILDNVGTRIRETHKVFRPQDNHCTATGGLVSRFWHWDGARLFHGPSKRSGAMFVSPTRNLWCIMAIKSVDCQATQRPHTAHINTRGALRSCRCQNLGAQPQSVPRLRYGRSLAIGAFRCTSAMTGVTCVAHRTGRGFTINKTKVIRVTP